MKNRTKAIINFVYFAINFPHDFISEVWRGDRLKNHIQSKFKPIEGAFHMDLNSFFHWFMNLDQVNMEKLVDFVQENYIAHLWLKQESEYYLFGQDACRTYANEDFDVFLKEMKKTNDFGLYEFTPGQNGYDLLSFADGWMDHAQISKEEYNTLLKL